MRRPLLLVLVLALCAMALGTASAQGRSRPGIELTPPARGSGVEQATLRGYGLLTSSGEIRELLRSGFPAQLHFRVELWSAEGFTNDLEAAVEWDIIVRQDPLDRSFRVARVIGSQVTQLGHVGTLTAADALLASPTPVPLPLPRRGRRAYYAAQLDIEILSLSDLDEVQRWLKGEARPALRGRRNPGTALTRGLRRLVVRVIGGETRRYEARTGTFVVE